MQRIPRDESLDATLAFLADGYRYVSKRCARHGTDVFETRLALRRVVCMLGEEAAQVFYGGGRFTRRGALPPTTVMLLQDRGSVQALDGDAHRRRKAMFLSLMTPPELTRIEELLARHWEAALASWEGRDEVVLHDAVREILCRTACEWAGVPLTEREVRRRTREFGAMIDGAGSIGPRNWWGLLLRTRTERWARRIIRAVRAGDLPVPEGCAAQVIARHRGPDGRVLEPKIAAVELLNILRPTVAVARYVVFSALALHRHPECAARLRTDDDAYLEWFVHEVRRFYPFFPAIAGRVRQPFEWRGRYFAEGTWMLLDLYGTNHDARIWEEPESFRPERFRDWNGSAFGFVPQGGGDHRDDHRCAGEWLTIALMKRAARLLTGAMRYDVPAQDLRIDFGRMPALPESGFVIRNVRRPGARRSPGAG